MPDPEATPPRLLLVDDSSEERAIIRRYLRTYTSDVFEAGSGAEALEMFAQHEPTIVLLDQHLGDRLGTEVIATLLDRGHLDVAFIILTGSSEDAASALSSGADDFVSKEGLRRQELLRVLTNAQHKARARAELQRAQSSLAKALDEVTTRLDFESRLIGVVSHDLRTPLQTLSVGLDLLAQGGLDPVATSTVQRCQRALRTAAGIVERLLDLTRFRQHSGFVIEPEPLDVRALLEDQIEQLGSSEPDREIVLRYHGEPRAWLDRVGVGQIALNLISNALRHGTPDRPVTVVGHHERGVVSITVRNEGTPIPPQVLEGLFSAFTRGKASKGLGLGLYISREIAQAHGGTLTATSDPIGMILFRATIPSAPRPEPPDGGEPPAPSTTR